MYKVSVPIQNRSITPKTRKDYLSLCREASVERVFLVVHESDLPSLKENIVFLKEGGLEVGVWIGETIGHGGALLNGTGDEQKDNFLPLVNVLGEEREGTRCPLDAAFRKKIAGFVIKIAEAHPSYILLDDDLRMSGHGPAFCCACPSHLALMSEHLGEEVTLTHLQEQAFSGKPNQYRDAWLFAQNEGFRILAEELRAAIDTVDESITLAFCAAHSIWDVDGMDVLGISRIMAGKNKPLLRLHGAPYWTPYGGNRLSAAEILALARMFASFCEGSGIETMAEGDVYPRPRCNTPAAYLELFDAAMRADGKHDGILKYMFDYTAGPFFERGYIERHKRSAALHAEIARNFPNGAHLGVRVHIRPHAFDTADFSLTKPLGNTPMPIAGILLDSATVPTVYSGEGFTAAAFGEGVRGLPMDAFANGMILDAVSASILTEAGMDVGLASVSGFEDRTYSYLSTVTEGEIAPVRFADCRRLSAAISSSANTVLTAWANGKEEPFAYTYENAEGLRFLVYLIDYGTLFGGSGLLDSCVQNMMLTKTLPWLSRRPMPIASNAHPGLYLLADEDEAGLSLLFLNYFADEVITPVFTLGKTYKEAHLSSGAAHTEGNRLVFDTDIPAFSAVAVRLKK